MKVRMGLLALVFLAGSVGVNAQPGGGMGRGGGMRGNPERMEKVRDQMAALRAFPVDEVWAALSLGMDVPDDKLKVIRVIMTDAWKKRQEWLVLAQEHGSWKDVKEELEDLKKAVDGQLKSVLDKNQQKALQTLLKQNERANRPGRL